MKRLLGLQNPKLWLRKPKSTAAMLGKKVLHSSIYSIGFLQVSAVMSPQPRKTSFLELPRELRQQILLDTHDLETEYQRILVIDDLFPDTSVKMIHHVYRLEWKIDLFSNSIHNWVSFLSYGSGRRLRGPCYWSFDRLGAGAWKGSSRHC